MKPTDRSSSELIPGNRYWVQLALCIAIAAIAFLGPRVEKLMTASVFARPSNKASGSLKLSARDSMTGQAVHTQLTSSLEDRDSTELSTDASGRGQYLLSAGRHDFEIEAPGYQSLKTHFEVQPETTLDVTVWVDPKEPPEELRPEVIKSKLRPGYVMLHGHILDAMTGSPLQGVTVHLEQSAREAQTDDRGYFLFYAPAPVINPIEELPKTDNLIADLDGFKTYRRVNILLAEGAAHFIIDMKRGEGVAEHDATHKLMRSSEELRNSQGQQSESTAPQAPSNTQEGNGPGGRMRPMAVTVPSSIRVGFNCSCSTCSTVQVYSLDTYVRLGLDDEWIASWSVNSLRAGAIAYRSYGVYHVYHPKDPNYEEEPIEEFEGKSYRPSMIMLNPDFCKHKI